MTRAGGDPVAHATAERLSEADRLLVGDARRAPQPGEAARAYAHLAKEGSGAAAARLGLLAALGLGQTQDWDIALDFLAFAASLDDASAQMQLVALAGREVSGADWQGLRQSIGLESLLTPPPARIISESPVIRVVEGFAPPAIAAWLIAHAEHRLQHGEVNDSATGEVHAHPMRSAKSAPFNLLTKDVVTVVMQERAARATQVPMTQHEPPNVISYLPGQEFQPHYDYVDPAVPHFQMELMLQGQRVATVVTYLNDGFEGAETAFPRLNWQFKGALGDALIFFNVDVAGRPDPRTLHAGLPPTKGRKWVLSQWLRDRSQPVL